MELVDCKKRSGSSGEVLPYSEREACENKESQSEKKAIMSATSLRRIRVHSPNR